MQNDKKEDIKQELANPTSVALTTDSWTSRAYQSDMTLTVHIVDDDWAIKNFVLPTKNVCSFAHR